MKNKYISILHNKENLALIYTHTNKCCSKREMLEHHFPGEYSYFDQMVKFDNGEEKISAIIPIENYYGKLWVKKKGEDHFWKMENYDCEWRQGCGWEPIPEVLYKELINHQSRSIGNMLKGMEVAIVYGENV